MTGLAAWVARGALALAVALASGASAQPGAAPSAPAPPAALARIEAGLWELKTVGSPQAPPLRLCVPDRRQLLQPMQGAPICRQFVAEAGADHVTVTYDCAARGQGRTALRVETPRLVQIDSQGISEGQPFAMRLEGRHAGQCGSGRAVR
jgi:hypothetical protein